MLTKIKKLFRLGKVRILEISMKHKNFLLIFLLLSLFSCSNDTNNALTDEAPAEKEKQIILVFCKDEKIQIALDAGATYAGNTEYLDKVKGGWTDFDVVIATRDMMKDVGRLGMILGRKGLMPNPKTGTVSDDVATAVKNNLYKE